jgi:hypothetical protein
MDLEITSKGIKIKPESVQDQAYIQHVLGLRRDGDWIPLLCVAMKTTKPYFIINLTAERFVDKGARARFCSKDAAGTSKQCRNNAARLRAAVKR